ncbi:bestrophin-like domain [Paraburkholderia bannensis]|uniref:bestrophin-like domain n=1 Tax=Paraburkholderia bannensis TaxID=765414 RepID=UPI002AB63CA0|nr:hypothetical protein [Paraburkholderia bannensis]
MILNWLYNNPTWLVGTVLIVGPVVLVCCALRVFHGIFPMETRREHNEYTGYVVAIIGINYAVLIAFVAVAVWGAYDHATAIASEEAERVGNLYRDAPGLGPVMGAELRSDLKTYVRTVVEEEWPAMSRDEYPSAGWRPLEHIQDALADYEPSKTAQAVYMRESLGELNKLYDIRRQRLSAAENGLEPAVWAIVLLGTVLTIGFTFLFGMPSLRMHMVMTGGVTAAAMLVLVLIIALDWPFRGEVQASPSMFKRVAENMRMLDAQEKERSGTFTVGAAAATPTRK